MPGGRKRRPPEKQSPRRCLLLEVALKAKRLVTFREQLVVDRAVDRVTGGASLADGFMLEDEGASLGSMAPATGVILGRERSPPALDGGTFVWIMAIPATDFAFQHRMMVREVEFATLVEVALKTGLGRLFGIDDRVIGATGFVVNTARAMARLTAHIRRIGTLGLQQRVGGSLKIPGDFFMTLLTSF
jgi:hypothetical protein